MKIKSDYILHSIAGTNVVIGVESEADTLGGALTLSDTSVFLWNILKDGATEEDLVKKILSSYNIDEETALKDVKAFVDKLSSLGILE